MIYGRPLGVPQVRMLESQHSLPQSVDDKYITLGQAQPDGTPSINAFFANSVNLYRVMDEIIERLHEMTNVQLDATNNLESMQQFGTSCRCSAVKQLAALLQLDGHLQKFYQSLPTHLKFSLHETDHVPDCPDEIQRQRVILKIRFLGMRILLHRQTILFLLQPRHNRRWPRTASQKWPPLFSDNAGDALGTCCDSQNRTSVDSPFEAQLAHLSASMCVTSARAQIETIDHFRPFHLTGAWWWDFHCTWSSKQAVFSWLNMIQLFLTRCVSFLGP